MWETFMLVGCPSSGTAFCTKWPDKSGSHKHRITGRRREWDHTFQQPIWHSPSQYLVPSVSSPTLPGLWHPERSYNYYWHSRSTWTCESPPDILFVTAKRIKSLPDIIYVMQHHFKARWIFLSLVIHAILRLEMLTATYSLRLQIVNVPKPIYAMSV